jgi:hypothetical protein
VAAAQRYLPSAPTPMTMDRQDGSSMFGLQLGFGFFDEPPGVDIMALGAQVYGQYVSPGGLGGYGILPFNYVSVDSGPDEDSEGAVGDIELGLLYAVPTRQVEWVFHGGVALPTASDDPDGQTANLLGSFMRFTDIVLAYPETTSLRLGVSPIMRSGQLVLRADIGLDVPVAGPGDDEPDPILRLNIGGGVDTGSFALLGELVNSHSTDEANNDNDWVNLLTITGRFRTGSVQPGVAIGFPLDEELNDLLDFFIAVGIQGAI